MQSPVRWKKEYSLNLTIIKHRDDAWRKDGGPPCDKHFQMPGHNFNAHAKFTITEPVVIIKVENENSQPVKKIEISEF